MIIDRKYFLVIGLLTFSITAMGNDFINFTWQATYAPKEIGITTTKGKFFAIKWGENSAVDTITGTDSIHTIYHFYNYYGSPSNPVFFTVNIEALSSDCRFSAFDCRFGLITVLETNCSALTHLDCSSNRLSELEINECIALEYLNCDYNSLIILDLTKNIVLRELRCSWNQLTTLELNNNPNLTVIGCGYNQLRVLDVTKNIALEILGCDYNQLSVLDVTKNLKLWSLGYSNNQINVLDLNPNMESMVLGCPYNHLQLSDLYNISEMMKNATYKCLGTQKLVPIQTKTGDPIDFSSQKEFGDVTSVFVIEKDSMSAIIGVEYTIDKGIIIFERTGNYTITMTNSAINSDWYPAEVIVDIHVSGVGVVDAEQIFDIQPYPNPTTGKVFLSTESNIKVYNMQGMFLQEIFGKEIDLSVYPQGMYLLQINGMIKKISRN